MAQMNHAPPPDPDDAARPAPEPPSRPAGTGTGGQAAAEQGWRPATAHDDAAHSPSSDDRDVVATRQTQPPPAEPAAATASPEPPPERQAAPAAEGQGTPSAPPPPPFAAPTLSPSPQYRPPQQTYTPAPAPQYGQQQYQQPAPQYGRAMQPATPQGSPAPRHTSPQLYVPRGTRKVPPARVGRRLLRRTVMGVSAALQAIFGIRPLLVVAFLALLGFTAWLAFDRWLAPVAQSLTPNAPSGAATITLPPESPTVLTYLDATKKGDANAVWETLGTEEKARRLERGDDKSVLVGVFEFQQENGAYYSTYHFIGARGMDGTDDVSRGGLYFYVADVKVGGQTRSLPLLFTVDDKGQITQVNDALYSIVLQQIAGGGGAP